MGYVVTFYRGYLLINAESESEARTEALQAIAEDLSLLNVQRTDERFDKGAPSDGYEEWDA